MEIVQAYGDAPKGVPLATFGSFDLLEIAVRDGSAAQHFGAGAGRDSNRSAAAAYTRHGLKSTTNPRHHK